MALTYCLSQENFSFLRLVSQFVCVSHLLQLYLSSLLVIFFGFSHCVSWYSETGSFSSFSIISSFFSEVILSFIGLRWCSSGFPSSLLSFGHHPAICEMQNIWTKSRNTSLSVILLAVEYRKQLFHLAMTRVLSLLQSSMLSKTCTLTEKYFTGNIFVKVYKMLLFKTYF